MKKSTCIHFSQKKGEDSKFYHTLEGVEIKLKISSVFKYSDIYYNKLSIPQKKHFLDLGFQLDSEYLVWATKKLEDNVALGEVVNYYVSPR